MEKAELLEFYPKKVSEMARRTDCNDDIVFGSFGGAVIFGGCAEKGAAPCKVGAKGHLGRATHAAHDPYPVGMDIASPEEISNSRNWIAKFNPEVATRVRGEKRENIRGVWQRAPTPNKRIAIPWTQQITRSQ